MVIAFRSPRPRTSELRRALTKFLRPHQIRVAEGRRLALVTELLERVGLQMTGFGVRRVGEHQVISQLGDPPVVALVETTPGLSQ
jgi:hypothetical protein